MDRRGRPDRRSRGERRSGSERRLDLVSTRVPTGGERRATPRRSSERREGDERRLALPLANQLRAVIDLLFQVNPERLVEGDRRRFESAIFRLRYAIDTLDETDEP